MMTREQIAKATELEEIVIQRRNKYLDAKLDYGEKHFVTKCHKSDWKQAEQDLLDYLEEIFHYKEKFKDFYKTEQK